MLVVTFPSIFSHIRISSGSFAFVLQSASMTTSLSNALMVIGVSFCTAAEKEKFASLVLLSIIEGLGAERNPLLTIMCIGIIINDTHSNGTYLNC